MGNPSVTIHIADRGTGLSTGPGDTSATGHMWYSLNDGNGNISSYGFSPDAAHQGWPEAPGAINALGPAESEYNTEAYSRTIDITPEQFTAMDHFGSDPAGAGFSMFYDGVGNSCIDFTWRALQLGGLNPNGFEGLLWPTKNEDAVNNIGTDHPPGGDSPMNGGDPLSGIPLPAGGGGSGGSGGTSSAGPGGSSGADGTGGAGGSGTAGTGPAPGGNGGAAPAPGSAAGAPGTGAGGAGGGTGAAGGPGGAGGSAGSGGTIAPRRDPLVLDLDGDGIETTNARDTTIKFDYDADGVKTSTGWVKPDDGWLVLDRNGNGTIDTGRELFGVDTIKSNGQLATDGFDALRDLDVNGDGKISSADTVFANLRIWRDLNQDGVSQANELTTLAANSISSIGVVGTAVRVDLGNGNVQTAAGTFTRTNGSAGAAGETDSASSDLDLLQNTFYSEFTTHVPISAQAAQLPTLHGSGQVRDLDEAMSLSGGLATLMQTYAATTTRQGQVALLDSLMQQWADTSNMKSLKAQATALASSGVTLTYNLAGLTAGTADYDAFVAKLGIVERFMGFTYGGSGGQARTAPLTSTSGAVSVSLASSQIASISLAYDRFKSDVYESLVTSTRLASYSTLLLQDGQDDKFAALEGAFNSAIAANPQQGLTDLLEFVSSVGEGRLAQVGWRAMGFLIDKLNTAPDLGAFSEELSSWTARLSAATEHDVSGTSRNDLLAGTRLDDRLQGGLGADILVGNSGNDSLIGGDGNDTLSGGVGNDLLDGGAGNDIYQFGRGDGQDTVIGGYDPGTKLLNTLVLKSGIAPSDLVLRRVADGQTGSVTALEVSIAGTTDKVTFDSFFLNDDFANPYSPLQQIEFSDGTIWTQAAILSKYDSGTSGDDALRASTHNDTIYGGAGNDAIQGLGGDDALYANDGADTLDGGDGNDTLDGGAGNDQLIGGIGNNTYLFGRGDGQDLLRVTNDATAGKLSTLQFKTGVATTDIVLRQVGDADIGQTTALEVSIAGTTDKIVINGVFYGDNPANGYNGVQQFKFADGTVWNQAAILAKLFAGTAGADVVTGTIGNDVMSGGAGADTLYGRAGNDSISGGADNDTLSGDDGNDTLDGGAGNDLLYGGLGNNTYLFGRGDGQDVVRTFNDGTVGKLNTLQFKTGVATTDVLLRQVGDADIGQNTALEVSINGTTDKIVLDGMFYGDNPANGYNSVQQFKFADGTVWNQAAILAKLFAGTAGADGVTGTTGNDVMSGAAGADTLYGRAGNDSLSGGADNDTLSGDDGNDTLDGGAGNDLLYGGLGNNTYLFGRGDGQDVVRTFNDGTVGKLNTLQFKTGVATTDIVLRQVGDADIGQNTALEVSINGTTDKIVLDGMFYGDNPANGYNSVQQFKFADGTVWNQAAILARLFAGTAGADVVTGTTGNDVVNGAAGADTLYGRAGDDALSGGADNDALSGDGGNDTLDGGAGNDQLNGGVGNNTYLFGRGDGQDVVRVTNDATAGKLNTLQMKTGVATTDVSLHLANDADMGSNVALEVSINGTTDKITLDGFAYGGNPANGYNSLQQIKFADGTTWNLATIESKLGMVVPQAVAHVDAQTHSLVQAMAVFNAQSAAGDMIDRRHAMPITNPLAAHMIA